MKFFSKHKNKISVVFAMLTAAFFSIFLLGQKNFALDELATMFIIKNWSCLVYFLKYLEGNMWLYYILVYFWSFLGHSEFTVRLVSVFFAVATIPIVFFIGK